MQRKKGFSYAKYGYIFSIPFVLIYMIFSLYPTIYTMVLGFTDNKGLGNTSFKILENPFENFQLVLSNQSFILSIKNTAQMWIMNFIPQILFALLFTAWFTSTHNKVRGQGFFKVVFYMPNIITAATIAILFNAIFGYPMGPANDIVVSLGYADSPINFLTNPLTAKIVVAFIQFWMWYGYTMIILISGVLGISPDIFEAAKIDGANSVQTFFLVTIPNLSTILIYTMITSMIGGLNMYDIPKLFLNGGPSNATLTSSVFIYNQAFSGSYMYNRAAAASMIMFIVIAFFSGLIFLIMRDKDEVKAKKMEKKIMLKERKSAKEAIL